MYTCLSHSPSHPCTRSTCSIPYHPLPTPCDFLLSTLPLPYLYPHLYCQPLPLTLYSLHYPYPYPHPPLPLPPPQVHSFDPTVNHPRNLAPNVTFHHWGLYGGDKQGASATFTHKVYGKIEGEMVTIDEMIEKLEHTEREISVFKMDCEGVFFSSRLPPPHFLFSNVR